MRGIRDEDGKREDAEPVTFKEASALKETERALLCEVDGKQFWIPKSIIHDDSEVFDAKGNREGALVLPQWFVEKEGIGQ